MPNHRLLALTLSVFVPAVSSVSVAGAGEFTLNAYEPTVTDRSLSPEQQQAMRSMFAAQGEDYQPRTELRHPDGSPRYLNRLIGESSPYLLQHAHNPVNWFSWGNEAFERARKENKPVFLSIGYATCHWCHVMERESFDNEPMAALLNRYFIAIKVDREQRPDIDATYMTAVQMMTGSGGWPMSTWLTPDARPFFGGTYFPPQNFERLLNRVAEVWQQDQAGLIKRAAEINKGVARVHSLEKSALEIGHKEITTALTRLLSVFDELEGGFGSAPKFPSEPALYLLLDQALRSGNPAVLEAADFTLQQMTAGGIHDHVGGGFHRYSVDSAWLVPHFEKMLYNQAALTRNYVQAYRLTGDLLHRRTAVRTLDYVLRDMRSPAGTFYSATDADSEGEEGRYFIWLPDEIRAALGEHDGQQAVDVWSVTDQGPMDGRSIIHWREPLPELAGSYSMTTEVLLERLDRWSEALRLVRMSREPPLLDDKVITEWNGMMISALAEAGRRLDRADYIGAAENAARALWTQQFTSDGALWRVFFNDRASVAANQLDYAYLAEAMIALYDATDQPVWLQHAEQLVSRMNALFWDHSQRVYRLAGAAVEEPSLPIEPLDLYDDATPSGNAVAMRVLSQLGYRTGDTVHGERARKLLTGMGNRVAESPGSFHYLLLAVAELIDGEVGDLVYTAGGKVKIIGRLVSESELEITLRVASGWHINAHEPLQSYLIGTKVELAGNGSVHTIKYPEPQRVHLGFERSELAVYKDTIRITVELDRFDTDRLSMSVSLDVQACSDQVCLAPESVRLAVFPRSAARKNHK